MCLVLCIVNQYEMALEFDKKLYPHIALACDLLITWPNINIFDQFRKNFHGTIICKLCVRNNGYNAFLMIVIYKGLVLAGKWEWLAPIGFGP